jgi:hypothetical protein
VLRAQTITVAVADALQPATLSVGASIHRPSIGFLVSYDAVATNLAGYRGSDLTDFSGIRTETIACFQSGTDIYLAGPVYGHVL